MMAILPLLPLGYDILGFQKLIIVSSPNDVFLISTYSDAIQG